MDAQRDHWNSLLFKCKQFDFFEPIRANLDSKYRERVGFYKKKHYSIWPPFLKRTFLRRISKIFIGETIISDDTCSKVTLLAVFNSKILSHKVLFLINPHKQYSIGVKSWLLGGHAILETCVLRGQSISTEKPYLANLAHFSTNVEGFILHKNLGKTPFEAYPGKNHQ